MIFLLIMIALTCVNISIIVKNIKANEKLKKEREEVSIQRKQNEMLSRELTEMMINYKKQ